MGIYLTIIGAADLVYGENYVVYTDEWKNHYTCHLAGFISLLSNEVSAITVSLITLDRFLVLRFPFSKYHFGRRSAFCACVLSWMVGAIVAAIPLLPR